MKIIKASAGSGKTYQLSHTYIKYLLESEDPQAYRHILAVTFTNKATAEMKERILKDLAADAKTNPRARKYLLSILHDYGAFGVSTIDRFFQQTLRSFARELGQVSSYQVELDKTSLITEAMDRMLDSVSPDRPDLMNWLRINAMEQISTVGRVKLDDGLVDFGKRIKSDEFRRISAGSADFSKERLDAIRKRCSAIIRRFESDAVALGVKPEKSGKIAWPKTQKAMNAPGVEELFTQGYRDYATACMVRSQLYGLGVAREFLAEYDALLKERNVLPLDESNSLLRSIIDGSDTPFVYERTGTRYAHYLLDEFQDTSRMQWDNFLPLLHDADASGQNLIVGDVKQSIYRWRDSDWRLLGSEVQAEFPSAEVEHSKDNWRSARAVVSFNSEFFPYAAAAVGLEQMYSNVSQNVKADEPQEGFVRVTFTSDQIAAVLKPIADVRSMHANYSDIAILVRNNKDGAAVAEALIAEGIPVISDDSLNLKNAVTVRRLISLLTFYDNPANAVGSYIATSIGVVFPDNCHSLVDFCEHLLRELKDYDPQTFEAEILYVGAFMDILQDWSKSNGNNLRTFIKGWQEKEDLFIGSPGNSDAVRIMTVHKSKGLEFPHVIFPFADKVGIYKHTIRWCKLNASGSALGSEASGFYPVDLIDGVSRTLFADSLEQERSLQLVDNLNIFYVALTRASKSLHVIAKNPSSDAVKALKAGKTPEWKDFSQILYAWTQCCSDRTWGTPYDFGSMKRKQVSDTVPFKADWAMIPLGGRLKASPDASDYFGPDGQVGPAASGRLRGIELHKVLASVDAAAGLPAGLDPQDMAMLAERIDSHPEWFSLPRARNEVTVFAADGSRLRPDRVMETPEGAIVIVDYKFGEERQSYLYQVRRYMSLYRDMGYSDVRGYVWYVPSDKVVKA